MNTPLNYTVNSGRILISNYGGGLAIGLQGTRDFIEQQFNRFFNCGAVSAHFTGKRDEEGNPLESEDGSAVCGQLHEIGENFQYFLSDETKMVEAIALHNHLKKVMSGQSKLFKKLPKEFARVNELEAQTEFDSYEREEFMSRIPTIGLFEVFGKGTISAEKE